MFDLKALKLDRVGSVDNRPSPLKRKEKNKVTYETQHVPFDTTLDGVGSFDNRPTTVLLPCLMMLQRVSRSNKGHLISEKFDTNENVK